MLALVGFQQEERKNKENIYICENVIINHKLHVCQESKHPITVQFMKRESRQAKQLPFLFTDKNLVCQESKHSITIQFMEREIY